MAEEKKSIKKPSGWNIFYQNVAPAIKDKLSKDSDIGKVCTVASKMWREIGGERRKDWRWEAQKKREDLDMGLLEEQQKCPNCNRRFSREKDYRLHKKGCHTDICKDCGQCFQNLHSLNTHISLVHTQAFKCDDCDKCFANKRNLNRHQVGHMGIKIQCEVCHSEFSTKGSMQRHMKQQHL